MKLSELVIGTDYAIVPSWTYSNRQARDVSTVRENDVVKATLLSLDKYEYEPSNRKYDPNDFTKAQAGNRSVGVLVKATDSNGNTMYWTSRLADIVAPYSQLEPKWSQAKSAEEEAERIRKEQYDKVMNHKRTVANEAERVRVSVVATAKELLGDKSEVSVDTEGYDLDYKAVVKISLAEFEKLIELSYAGMDN